MPDRATLARVDRPSSPRLTEARDEQVLEILLESHVLWGSGLTPEHYVGLWNELRATRWGRHHAGLFVWEDVDGRVLSSVKLYRPPLRVFDRTAPCTVIGALFTPPALRRRGHARDLVRAAISKARDSGQSHVLLFSDIGAGFYTPLGFRSLPANEHWGRIPVNPGAPAGWSLRAMEPADFERVREAHDDFCRSRPIAMLRDSGHWGFVLDRAVRFFERLDDSRLGYHHVVALEHGRFAGYLMTIEGRGEWNLREVGARGGDPCAMAAILRLGAAAARRRGLDAFYGWLPPGVRANLADWRLREHRRGRAVPMLLTLEGEDPGSRLQSPSSAYLSFLDQF